MPDVEIKDVRVYYSVMLVLKRNESGKVVHSKIDDSYFIYLHDMPVELQTALFEFIEKVEQSQ